MECVAMILIGGGIAFWVGCLVGYGKHPESSDQAASMWETAYRQGYDACDEDTRAGIPGARRPQ